MHLQNVALDSKPKKDDIRQGGDGDPDQEMRRRPGSIGSEEVKLEREGDADQEWTRRHGSIL
jgi:hypothetical protein